MPPTKSYTQHYWQQRCLEGYEVTQIAYQKSFEDKIRTPGGTVFHPGNMYNYKKLTQYINSAALLL